MRFALCAFVLLLAGCSAAPQDPCSRRCTHMYDSCMDAGANITNPSQLDLLSGQCENASNACVRACRQDMGQ